MRNLDRKVFDVNEARHIYEGRIEDVNDIMTALLREERLRVTPRGRRAAGRKHLRARAVHVARLQEGPLPRGLQPPAPRDPDASRSTASARSSGCRGDHFEYPADYRPEQLTEGAFGLIRGEPTRVRIRFDATVARYIQRRQWHPTQKFRRGADGGVEMTMEVRGTVELVSWVLGFGEKARVLEPAALRAAVAAESSNARGPSTRDLDRCRSARSGGEARGAEAVCPRPGPPGRGKGEGQQRCNFTRRRSSGGGPLTLAPDESPQKT